MAKGNKRHKIVHILAQVKQRTLQILPDNSQYFAELRRNYLQNIINVAESSLTELELAVARLDDRIIQA